MSTVQLAIHSDGHLPSGGEGCDTQAAAQSGGEYASNES